MEIIQLPTEVVDQIAAGEVVERPAHLVKELIENSLDAGANSIQVDFSSGGRQVKIIDNGKGIGQNDLAKALDRFATSKIRLTDDLWKLKTFGFRGEALASISAVSRLTLRSKTKEASSAYQIQSLFGQKGETEKSGGGFGTTVIVESLFENVPARLKFMKSDAAEMTQIKTTLKALALAYPQVEFRVSSQDELIFFWPEAKTRKERVAQILEVDSLYVGEAEREGVRAYSVFSDPNTTAKTSKNIWLFAQNRWIQDRGLQAAVNEAYRSLLMHGEYPICVSWVETAAENIDVNIHPTKSQVKFLNSSAAFRAVQASVRDILEKAPWIARGASSGTTDTQKKDFTSKDSAATPLSFQFADKDLGRTQFQTKITLETLRQSAPSAMATELTNHALGRAMRGSSSTFVEDESVGLNESKGFWSSLQILSQANLTYILTQSQTSLMIVDQHAAHERVNFEKLMAAWRGGKIDIQDYLFPLAIDLSADKVEALKSQSTELSKLGIYLEELGPTTMGIKAAPLLIKEASLLKVIEKMAQDILDHGGSFSMEKMIGDVCATLACHSSIRAGQALSLDEMKSLLANMDEFPMSSFCPHGRPVWVEYPFAKLEKEFGRTL